MQINTYLFCSHTSSAINVSCLFNIYYKNITLNEFEYYHNFAEKRFDNFKNIIIS